MLIEFTGPPGSGKTSIAELLRHRGFVTVRTGKDPIKKVWLIVLCITHPGFIITFINNYRFMIHQQAGVIKKSRLLLISFFGAMTRMFRNRNANYIRDQGFLQFGDWVTPKISESPEDLAKVLIQISAKPDIAVLFSLPPSLSVARLATRGDLGTWQVWSKKRGFSSVKERLEFQRSKEWIKIELCKRLDVPCIVVNIDQQGNIDKIIKIKHDLTVNEDKEKVLEELVVGIKESWKGLE
jgi:hypothetical protein